MKHALIGVYATDLVLWLKESYEPTFYQVQVMEESGKKKIYEVDEDDDNFLEWEEFRRSLNYDVYDEFVANVCALFLCGEYLTKEKHANKNDNWLIFRLHAR